MAFDWNEPDSRALNGICTSVHALPVLEFGHATIRGTYLLLSEITFGHKVTKVVSSVAIPILLSR